MWQEAIAEHIAVIEALSTQQPALQEIAMRMADAILFGRKVIWFGNGGSAADAQHLAAAT
ncbi:MAG: SIS domain-containing protein [Silvibacterium sp.]